MKLTFNQPLSLSHAEEIVTVENRSDTTHTGLRIDTTPLTLDNEVIS